MLTANWKVRETVAYKYVVADISNNNYFGEKSKNRKYSAPISGIKSSGFKFTRSTNFY